MVDQTIKPIRICLIDSHSIVLHGLEKLIDSRKPEMEVVGKFANCAEACSQLERLSPDIILLDLNLDNRGEANVIPQLIALSQANILIFTGLPDPSIYDFVMLSGAKGILSKKESLETILKAIEKVHKGEIWLDQLSISRILNQAGQSKDKVNNVKSKFNKLTQGEKRVLSAIMTNVGAPAKVIAATLDICESTLRNHLTSIYEKLDVSNKLELWSFMHEHKLNKQL